LSKSKVITVLLAVIFISILAALGFWYIQRTNERLLTLQERTTTLDWNRRNPHPIIEPTPTPTFTPAINPTPEPPRTSDIIPVDPEAYLTRAMFTAMVARLEGNETDIWYCIETHALCYEEPHILCCAEPYFTDVPADEWYTGAVAWAFHAGIVSGIGNQAFAPEAPINREQMAVLLFNYLRFKERTIPVTATDFIDRADVSEWAVTMVDAIRLTGIVPDRPDNRFDPQGGVTNAEADAVFARLVAFLHDIPEVLPGIQDLDDYGNWLPPFEHTPPSPLPVHRNETLVIPHQ
jgi:hypothetical protein